jgi:tRNA pseudouridine32 synthase/23S rRNA pseudouridine746 synthase
MDDPPATVLDWLDSRFAQVSRETWVRRMEQGLVHDADGRPLGVEAPYVPHLRLSYYREVEAETLPSDAVRIIHLDDSLVVADKPPFLPVVPGGRFVRGCLLYLLEEQLGVRGLAPAHRLDRATSGVVLLTRRAEERSAYTGLFAQGRVERVYRAIAKVPTRPTQRQWQVESRIVSGTPFFRRREVEGTPNAWTTVELVSWHAGFGHFILRPASGKPHQLRLHMVQLGWPILGDRLYPDLLPEAPDDPAAPLCLVAQRLAFRDPFSGAERVFESASRLGSWCPSPICATMNDTR